MTVDDLRAKFKALEKEFQSGIITEKAAKDVMTQSVTRIFDKGLTTNGSSFQYSNKPAYFGDGPQSSNKTGKTGKRIKTGYYKGGYAEYRKQQGRENKFVNWRLTNELQSDYANSEVSGDNVAEGIPIKVSNTTYVITLNKQINIEKREGLENKYGSIFDLNTEEEQQFTKSSQFLLDQLINKYFAV